MTLYNVIASNNTLGILARDLKRGQLARVIDGGHIVVRIYGNILVDLTEANHWDGCDQLSFLVDPLKDGESVSLIVQGVK